VSGLHAGALRLDTLIPAIIFLVALVGLLVVIPIYRRAKRRDKYTMWDLGVLAASIVTAFALLVLVVGTFPWIPRFWFVYHATGVVQPVTNTFDHGTGTLTLSGALVKVEGINRPIFVEDSRLMAMAGQSVDLTCDLGFNYAAADDYSCRVSNFGGAK